MSQVNRAETIRVQAPEYINTLYELFDLVRQRPAMYFGSGKLSDFRAFLAGFQVAQDLHEVDFAAKEEPDFGRFSEWVAQHYGWEESTAGWKNIILHEVGDEEDGLTQFFRLVDDFRARRKLAIAHAIVVPERCKVTFYKADRKRRPPIGIKLMSLPDDKLFYLTKLWPQGKEIDGRYFTDRSSAMKYAQQYYGVSSTDWIASEGLIDVR